MPGERYASLTLRIKLNFVLEPHIWLNGAYRIFSVPPRPNLQESAQALVDKINEYLLSAGQVGTYTTQVMAAPVGSAYDVRITATSFLNAQNFQPTEHYISEQLEEVERLDGIKPVIVQYSTTLAQCFGASTGSITLTGVGNGTNEPTGPYTYLWNDGVTTRDRALLAAGTYTVRVQDATPAYRLVTILVGQNPDLVVQLHRAGSTLTSTVSGGVAPYTYLWADGPTTPDHPGATGGVTYTLTVTDAKGCSKSASIRFELLRYWFSGNPIPLTCDAGEAYRLDPSTKPGLRFACEVFVEPDYLSGTFVPVGAPIEQPADAQGRTTFEVQELLEPFVATHLPRPGQAQPSRADGLFRRFYLRHYELTLDGVGEATVLDDNYLVKGGLDFREAGLGTWFSGYQAARLPFFTHEPDRKKVLPDQPEHLYWQVPGASVDKVYLLVRVHFDDGTSSEFTAATIPDVRWFELYCLPVGFAQLGLALFEAAARVSSWQVFVLDQDGAPASEVRTFVLDRRPAPQRRYFLYANSLGGVNTLCVRGDARQELASTTRSGERALAAGYDPALGDVQVDRRTGAATLKCAAGERTRAQAFTDQDFLLSERVVWLEGGAYVAGTVKDRTLVALDDAETRRTLEFEFELPRTRYFTPRLS
jgi:hypothetical protein